MNLVVVESPSKAKTINKYLGKEFVVRASKGHVVDLPKSKLSIDVENDFKPDYIVTNPKSLKEIKDQFKSADKLILAVDLDREGEAIGWHIARELKLIDDKGKLKGKKPVERIVFSEITKEAIQSALKNPRAIDLNLVNAQQARRLLDRIVGYKLSPLLWKKIAFGLSAGRVQSVAVKLIVERERERDAFKSEEYWSIDAFLQKEKTKSTAKISFKLTEDTKSDDVEKVEESEGIKFELSKISNKKPELKNQKQCEEIAADVKGEKWIISDITSQTAKRYPKAPFITSTLQQSSVNMLGFTAKRTMSAAQKLYEAGLITYMRTDSTNMSNLAINQARGFIKKSFGDKYLPAKPNTYSSSNKSAQEAHECIRPADFTKDSDDLNLDGDLKRVYDLIWKRALASQMTPAELQNNALIINIKKYEFKSNGKRVLFDGFMKVYPEKLNESILPKLDKGTEIYLKEILSAQHFTQPPARYSEATLIKKLEELGIGRPSTYASIISTIVQRKYVENENKYLKPTDVGIVVNRLLEKYFNDIVDYNFTADMENDLDKVAEGKLDWVKMLKDFYGPFEKQVVKQDKNISRDEFTELGKSDEKCPLCGSPMVIKLGKFGKFLSCTKYPECKGMLSIQADQTAETEEELAEYLKQYESAPKTEDGQEYVLKTGRYGKFWAHPNYPKVKDAKPLVLTKEGILKMYGTIPQTDDGRDYLLRRGKFGEFWAHPDYPKVKDIKKIPKKKQE
jgi:DNA topoisomerase-1